MADTLESLEIEVKHSASGAASEIEKVSNAISEMGKALGTVLPDLRAYAALVKQIGTIKAPKSVGQKMQESIESSDKGVLQNIKSVTSNPLSDDLQAEIDGAGKLEAVLHRVESAAKRMHDAFKKGNEESAWRAKEQQLNAMAQAARIEAQAQKEAAKAAAEAEAAKPVDPVSVDTQELIKSSSEIDILQRKLESLRAAMSEAFAGGDTDKAYALQEKILKVSAVLDKAKNSAVGAGKATKETADGIKRVASAAKKSNNPLKSFVDSLKRIAFYRIIRGIIKGITQAFQEGLEKAYLFSAGVSGEGNRFAAALDRMKSAGNQMKGQLGAAFAALLTAIEPILITLINLVTKAANVITQFLSAFTGNTYLKATDASAKFADNMKAGGAAAKEWRNQLLGFDEINRLNEPNKGGGGGGANPLQGFSFEDTPIDGFIKTLVDKIKKGDWGGVVSMLTEKLREAIRRIDWKSVGADLWAFIKSIFSSEDGAADASQSFWETVGTALGAAVLLLYGFFEGIVDDAYAALKANFVDYDGDNKIGLLDILKGIWKTGDDILDWIWEEVVQPFAKGLVETITGKEFKSYTRDEIHEVGKNICKGLWEGWKEEYEGTTIGQIMAGMENLIAGVKKIFGIQSPSTVFKEIGKNVIQGFWNGLDEMWGKLLEWWDKLSLPEFHIPSPHFNWTYSEASGMVAKALEFVGLPPTIPHLNISWYAQGGFPQTGDLFFANENGAPELVGSIGGRTAVAPSNDIVEAVREGVYDAVTAAISNSDNGDAPKFKLYMDSREIKYALKQVDRAWGVG